VYANFVEIVVRKSVSDYDEEADEVLVVRAYPADETVDAARVTQETRAWLLDGRHTRFLMDERRRYVDVGAEASSVEFVLTLLASGATGVALQEVVNFIKGRLNLADDDDNEQLFRETDTEDLGPQTAEAAERALGLGRGDLEIEDLERDAGEIRLSVRRRSNDARYRVARKLDGTLRIRKLS
jgi:hypothetical protein